MTKTITITIDNQPVTLTARDIKALIGIARDIDRATSLEKIQNLGRVSHAEQQRMLKRLYKWLDTHGPDATEWGTT